VAAASAAEAIACVRDEFLPDVVLSDIGMPREDGYEFIRQFRSLNEKTAKIPVAALTALAQSEDRQRALLEGFQLHLAKPVNPFELVAAVGNLAGRIARRAA
jgi:CheY-like chemotaxis protein